MLEGMMVLLMAGHGLIHSMGGLSGFGFAKIEGMSGKTIFPIPQGWKTVFSSFWFAGLAMFILAALGLGLGFWWWKFAAYVAVVVSQATILIYWPDAKWGTVPNALVLIGMYFLE